MSMRSETTVAQSV